MIAPLVVAMWLGAVHARVQPEVVTFGDRTPPQVDISVVGQDNLPAGDAKVRLAASVGSFAPVKLLGKGHFQAAYLMPAKRMPQMVIILVEVELRGSRERAWLTLPLHARADLRIETKPRARLTVDVGDRRFGPVVADRAGRAVVAAVIPPCLATAQVHATDPAGNVSEKPLDLKPVPFPRALVSPSAERASWADREPTPVEVFALDASCAPVGSAAGISLIASVGTVGAPSANGRGLLVFPYRAPDEVGTGNAKLTVQLATVNSAVETNLPVVAGPQTGFSIRFEPKSFVAGSGAPVHVVTLPADGRGNEVPGGRQPDRVLADFGVVTGKPPSAVIVLPDKLQGRDVAVVRGEGDVGVSQARLPLEAAPPSAMEWVSKPRFIRAGETLEAEVRVTDAFGNPVPHASLEASVGGGSATVQPLNDGRYRISARVPENAAMDSSEIRVEGRTVSGRAEVEVGQAQRPWAFLLGASLTVQTNFMRASALVPRLNLGLRVARSNFDLLVEGEAGLYKSFTAPTADGAGELRTSLTGTSLLVGGRYSLPIAARWTVYATAALGVETYWSTLELRTDSGTRSQGDRKTSLLLRGALGSSVALGRGRLFAQVEGSWAAAHGQVTGNLGGLGIGVGYLYGF